MKIIEILKNHKWAVILAVLAGLILAFPQFYFRYDYKDAYQGLDLSLAGAELYYQGRIQEVRDGYLSIGNVWFAEYKDRPYIQTPLGEIIVAYLGKAFSLDINNTILLSRFLFPALILLAIYGFVYFLTRKKYVALVASPLVVLAEYVLGRPYLNNLLHGEALTTLALHFTRPINPHVSSLLFFAFLLFFWLLLSHSDSKAKKMIFGILSGILWGMSFYVFFYTWSLISVFVGVLALIFLIKKEWLDLKKVLLVAAVALIVAVPYILSTFQSMQYPEYLESSQRLGLIEGHKPTIGFLVPGMLIIIFLILHRAWQKQKRYIFSIALFVAILIVQNQQIITGKLLINDHYHWYYSKPLALIFLTICFFEIIERIVRSYFLKKIIIVGILSAIILNVVAVDVMSYYRNIEEQPMIESQRYGPVINWLNANAQKDDVVLAESNLSILISIYTPLNLALDPKWANQYLVPQRELLERLFLWYRLKGVSAKEAPEVFLKEKSWISMMIFSEYYRQTLGEWEYTPDEAILPIIEDYKKFSDFPVEKLFQRFNVKYAVWDKIQEPKWNLDRYPFLKEVYQKDKIKIYQVQL